MDSDDNSTTTVYNTISQYNNSDIKTPDEFANSEQSPSTFSQSPFKPLLSQTTNETSPAPSSHTDVTPIYSPLTSDSPDSNYPVDTELENKLDNFMILQQKLQHPHTLTIHQLL